MNEILFFILGLIVGSLVGIALMCFLQINKLNELTHKNC